MTIHRLQSCKSIVLRSWLVFAAALGPVACAGGSAGQNPTSGVEVGELHAAYMTFVNSTQFGYVVNAHQLHDGGNINMWAHNPADSEQDWAWSDDKLKLRDTELCLSALVVGNGGNVIVKACDPHDANQKWAFDLRFSDPVATYWVRLKDTNYCLNAHDISDGSKVNLRTCKRGDTDQLFEVVE